MYRLQLGMALIKYLRWNHNVGVAPRLKCLSKRHSKIEWSPMTLQVTQLWRRRPDRTPNLLTIKFVPPPPTNKHSMWGGISRWKVSASHLKGWVFDPQPLTEWIAVALLGQERSPQPSGKKHNSGFGLSPIAVTKSYKIKLKKQTFVCLEIRTGLIIKQSHSWLVCCRKTIFSDRVEIKRFNTGVFFRVLLKIVQVLRWLKSCFAI